MYLSSNYAGEEHDMEWQPQRWCEETEEWIPSSGFIQERRHAYEFWGTLKKLFSDSRLRVIRFLSDGSEEVYWSHEPEVKDEEANSACESECH